MKQKKFQDYNNFDTKANNSPKKDKMNDNLNKNTQKKKDKKKKKVKKKKNNENNYINHEKFKKHNEKRRAKSEEKNLNLEIYQKGGFIEESEEEDSQREIEYTTFMFDKAPIKKCFDKKDGLISFSQMSKLKEIFFDKNIKNFIQDSSKLNIYKCLEQKHEKSKKLEFESLVNLKGSFDSNKERLKQGMNKFLLNYENIILSKYCFSFDNSNIKKLDPFVDNPNDININYFSKRNQIFLAYERKNIKSLTFNSEEDIQKPITEIKVDNEDDIYGSISKINQRWLLKKKFTKKIKEPKTDDYKIYYSIKNSLEIPLVTQVFEEFVKQKIKYFQNDHDLIQKPNLDTIQTPFVTEIYFSFKGDNIKSQKINLDTDIFIQDSIEEINKIYNDKYLLKMDTKYEYLIKINKSIFSFHEKDINENYEKYKKWKNDRINRKIKYIFSENSSLELKKSTKSHITFQLNEFKDKSNNDKDNLKLTKFKSTNNNYQKYAKNKDEIDLSLSNKNNIINSKLGVFKNKSENLGVKKKLSSFKSQSEENEEKNSEYKNMMKKIKKSEDEINKKRRKMYADKIRQQQDNEFEQEIKDENKYRMIYPILFVIIPFMYSFFRYYWND